MEIKQPNWTKNDCARVVVQALFNMEKPPAADHFRVERMVKAHSKKRLEELRDQAIEAMASHA